MTTRQSAAAERGVRLITSGSDTSTDGIVCSAVSPRLTEWIPELLTALRPRSQQTVRQHATSDDPFRASSAILSAIHPEWTTTTDTWSDDTAEAVAYTRAITALALTYVDGDPDAVSAYHQERYADLIDTVESVGTGRGPVNGDLGALTKGPVALHRDLDDDPQPLTLLLDGEAWTELTDRRTGVRALAAIAVLGDGFDVRVVASPALQRELTRRYPRWSAIHLDLTADRDRSRRGGRRSRNQEAPTDAHPAWTALDGLAATPGKRRLLGNLTATHGRRYQDLEHDHAIGIEAGTVSRYVLDLENRGLVTVDRRGQHNTVRLSERGETAVTQFLDADDELVHPNQRRLDTGLTETPHESTSTVSPRREDHGEDTPTPIDEWVAATGDPDGEAEYVQWLQPPDGSLDTQSIHQRFAAAARGDGVTLVDDHLTPFDDGRVAYLSHHTNEAVVVAQWGGPLATLGRLAAALLSDKALSKILTPSRVGREFASIHDGVTDHDPGRTLRRGHQVGWFSESEEHYDTWRERVTTVRDGHLARLARLVGSSDTVARGSLFEDLHGLVATATHLYHAAGIDLTITLRVPDTASLATDDNRRHDFCAFLRHTVPKQTVYGVHSGYRMLFETRPSKLKRRLPYEVEEGATVEMTASWVLAGPTMTALQPTLTEVLDATSDAVREPIADGTEAAPELAIAVRDGTTYSAIRDVVDDIAATTDTEWAASTRRRLVRRCLRSFGPSESPARASPYDAAESLLRAITQTGGVPDSDAVERAAAQLPAGRFRPDLPPTATKLYATLLQAAEPCGRSELIERAGISGSSYDRHIETIADCCRVRSAPASSRQKWTVTPTVTPERQVEPLPASVWWSAHGTAVSGPPVCTAYSASQPVPVNTRQPHAWLNQLCRHTGLHPTAERVTSSWWLWRPDATPTLQQTMYTPTHAVQTEQAPDQMQYSATIRGGDR
ncbi:helix-turn-helix transcriptional regulator [Halorubrum laminariae]|uniref:Helix-turn-helix transcriptional regulator n=1 Tax=Halorubrum laminariae TaxID=1433523 RepID=A0ABD6C4F1_9EURY|nr:plasmid replication protein RepH [Halorubrum laminariae]